MSLLHVRGSTGGIGSLYIVQDCGGNSLWPPLLLALRAIHAIQFACRLRRDSTLGGLVAVKYTLVYRVAHSRNVRIGEMAAPSSSVPAEATEPIPTNVDVVVLTYVEEVVVEAATLLPQTPVD